MNWIERVGTYGTSMGIVRLAVSYCNLGGVAWDLGCRYYLCPDYPCLPVQTTSMLQRPGPSMGTN
jgi:hypothetical protein